MESVTIGEVGRVILASLIGVYIMKYNWAFSCNYTITSFHI